MDEDDIAQLAAAEMSFKAGWVLALQWRHWEPDSHEGLGDMLGQMETAWVEHELKIKDQAGLVEP